MVNVLTWIQASLIFIKHLLTLCPSLHGRFVTLTICHYAFPLTLAKELILWQPNYKYAFSRKYRLICMDIGFCLSFPFMNLAVFWCAASSYYPYIDSPGIGRISLCFAGRDPGRDWALALCFHMHLNQSRPVHDFISAFSHSSRAPEFNEY